MTIHGPKGYQLRLFMSGTEWKRSVNDSVDSEGEPMSQLWKKKEKEAKVPDPRTHPATAWKGEKQYKPHGAGVYDSMKTEGYRAEKAHDEFRPRGNLPTIEVSDDGSIRAQGEGHHRIAAAAALERERKKTTGRAQPIWIPTHYTEW